MNWRAPGFFYAPESEARAAPVTDSDNTQVIAEPNPTPTTRRVATAEVLEISKIKFEGHIIPQSWYKEIKMPDGKPDLNAIVILSDVVYWYRPKEKDGSDTGLNNLERKFHSDILQRSYKQLTEQFGLTKFQSRAAIGRLKKLGLIEIVFKTVRKPGQRPLSNVMYIRIFPQQITRITYPLKLPKRPKNSTL